MQSDLDVALRCFEDVRHHRPVALWLERLAAHDDGLLRHSLLVGAVAATFAHKAGLDADVQRAFVTGALLHDVGKITIPPWLLHKRGPLSSQERHDLESHAIRGYRMLEGERWPAGVLELVHLHHERLDGSGYPNGYAAESLGEQVRMLALCDVFSALIEDRVYRPRPNRPLEIMATMTDGLDDKLLHLFTTDVSSLAFGAKNRLYDELQEPARIHVH